MQQLKLWPKVSVCNESDARVEYFCKHFVVLNFFIEPTKILCDWEWITTQWDADAFHDCSTLFPF